MNEDHVKEFEKQKFYNSLTSYQKGTYHILDVQRKKLNSLHVEAQYLEMQGNGMIAHNIRGCVANLESILDSDSNLLPDDLQPLHIAADKSIKQYETQLQDLRKKINYSKRN